MPKNDIPSNFRSKAQRAGNGHSLAKRCNTVAGHQGSARKARRKQTPHHISVDELPVEARRVLRALYTTEADLVPDTDARTLTARLHHCANAATDQMIEKLCQELNATETIFPRTNLRLVLKLGPT